MVDQSGALLDQGHFIPAQQAKPQHQRIGRRHGRPTLAFKVQRLGQGQAINPVGFDPAGPFARAIGLGASGMHRVNAMAHEHQPFNGIGMARFNGDGQSRKSSQLLLTGFPALGCVFKLELDDDVPR